MHRRSLPLAAAVACAASLGLAGTAAAETTTYEGTLNLTYAYKYSRHSQTATQDHHSSTTITGSYAGTYDAKLPFVQIEDGRVLMYRAGLASAEAKTTGSSETSVKDDWSGDKHFTCTADGTEPYRFGRVELGNTTPDTFVLRPFEELEVAESCDDGTPGGFRLKADVPGMEADFDGPMDFFT